MTDFFTIPSPIGNLGIKIFEEKLSSIEFLHKPSRTAQINPNKAISQALQSYFKNPNYIFDLPLHLTGTPFQLKVWRALQNIPAGKTVTYGDLAKQLKSGPRAIGNACRANPLPIIIPCHRVVAQSHLGGYAGKTQGSLFQVKIWLLTHEKNIQPKTSRITRHG